MNDASTSSEISRESASIFKKELTGGQLVLAGLIVLLALGAALIWEVSQSNNNFHNPEAFSLGLSAFEDGRYDDATHWYENAAKQGEPQAQYALAMMHINRQIKDADIEQAKSWLVHAAQQNFAKAQYQLAILLEKEGNEVKAYDHWLDEAAQQGMPQAILHITEVYDAQNTPEDSQKAWGWVLKAQKWHLKYPKTLKSSLLSHIQAQAKAGVASSMYLLGKVYKLGYIVQINKPLAYQWMLKAAQHKHIKASESVAEMLFHGEGVTKNMQQAFHWFQSTNGAGSIHAKAALGCMLVLGLGNQSDLTQGMTLLKQAAQEGSASAARNLGIIEAQGLLEEVNNEAAFQWFKQASDAGDAAATNSLGVMYALGRGTQTDMPLARKKFEEVQAKNDQAQFNIAIIEARGLTDYARSDQAVAWLKRAETHGNQRAAFVLGLLYAKGKGVPQDTSQAIEYYQRAIQHGDLDAKYNLAMLEYHGDHGLPLDAVYAKKLLTSLAKVGDARAQNMLGNIEINGLGMKVDISDAFHWYQQAAKQGYDMAQFNLGNMYRSGRGTRQNDQRASYWYAQASNQGFAPAQNTLAYMYAYGRGVPINKEKAKKLLQKASQTLRQAGDNLQRLSSGSWNFSLLGSMVDNQLRGNLLATTKVDLAEWFQMRALPFP